MQEPNPIKKDTVITPAVETFTDDMVKVIEDSQGGLIKKIIQEQERHEVEKKNFSPESKRNKLFVLVSLVLILLSVSMLAFLFFQNNDLLTATNPKIELATIIYSDKVKLLPIDGSSSEEIVASVLNEVAEADLKVGGVESLYLTENNAVVGLRKFLALTKSNFVPGDVSMVGDHFLMGVVNRESKDLFILLKVKSFIDIFPVLRAWENKMFTDLHSFFGVEINPDTSALLTKNFEDGIIENKNARILYDDAGNIVLMYVFVDENNVIFGKNRDAVREAMVRLASSRIKK
jgi:hypothetical protein